MTSLILALLSTAAAASPPRIELEPGLPRLCVSEVPAGGPLKGKRRARFDAGVAMLRAGQAEEAATAFHALGGHPAGRSGLAAGALVGGQVGIARALYGGLVAEFPGDGCLLQAAALVDLFASDPGEGAARAASAWALMPGDPDAGLVHASWLFRTDPKAAEAVLADVAATTPNEPAVAATLGTVRLNAGDAHGAIPLLEAARTGGVDTSEELFVAYFYGERLGDYLRLASEKGLPLGDSGAIATSADPIATWRGVLGLDADPVAVIETSAGTLRCALFPEQAPVTVANFVGLARGTLAWTHPETGETGARPLYPGTVLHRVIPQFMIQGGDPLGTGTGGPGYRFRDELDPDLAFDRPGVLAMANAGPDTNGSQFFVTEVPTPHLTGRHTIFGQCDAPSVEVVTAISRAPRSPSDKPTEGVVLQAVRFE